MADKIIDNIIKILTIVALIIEIASRLNDKDDR